MIDGGWKRPWRRHYHWVALAVMVGVAIWHYVDFGDTPDSDFPTVVRPHFNAHPPAAYRLSEPGDTLDRIGLYLAAAALTLGLVGVVRVAARRRAGAADEWSLWPAAAALAAAATWYAATPGPAFDGWYGLGWRSIFDARAPWPVRAPLISAAMLLGAIVVANIAWAWSRRRTLWEVAVDRRTVGLLVLAPVLVGLRQFVIPGVEPVGYWPRCSGDLGILAFALLLLRARPAGATSISVGRKVGIGLGWAGIVVAGVALTLHHRPIARLRPVVPGRIYISAMPSYRGLAIEQQRLGFKTIINLFDESSTQASPYHDDEIRFVREHGLRYLGSPADGLESDRFLDETFTLAQDPDAWPILVHCHGCMDRSPAWMGMYRFLIEKQPLAAIFREIEQHRGTRPKAVVTLQYNRKLPQRAPEQFANDPTGALLLRCAAGTKDPFHLLDWNPYRTDRQVVRRIDPDPSIRRP